MAEPLKRARADDVLPKELNDKARRVIDEAVDALLAPKYLDDDEGESGGALKNDALENLTYAVFIETSDRHHAVVAGLTFADRLNDTLRRELRAALERTWRAALE